MDPNLLRMAKLDYNIVQSVYTKECSCTGSTISSGASADENLPQLNQELENQHSQNFWKVASISSDDSDSDSEDHEKTKSKVPVKNVHVAAATKKNDVSSDDSDDSRSSDDDSAKVASQAKKSTANVAKNGFVVVTKNKDESGDSLESEEESDEEDETSVKVTSKDAPTKVSAVTFKKGKDNTSDSESDDDSDELLFLPSLYGFWISRYFHLSRGLQDCGGSQMHQNVK